MQRGEAHGVRVAALEPERQPHRTSWGELTGVFVPGIDESRPFVPVQIAILTVSDTRTEADDRSGDTLCQRALAAGHKVVARRIVTDDVGNRDFECLAFWNFEVARDDDRPSTTAT